MSEWELYQIPHVGVPEPDRDSYTRTDVATTIRRPLDMKMSNFGALNVGPRMGQSTDYSRTELTFVTKDNLSNWRAQTADDGASTPMSLRSVTVEPNPYITGSTVKRFRDDQFFRMTMEHYPYRTGLENFGDYSAGTPAYIDKPDADVMDQKEVSAGSIESYKNYPSEGWRSFGGKYDFLPYTGVLGRPRSNYRA